jgi:hypothetical protein
MMMMVIDDDDEREGSVDGKGAMVSDECFWDEKMRG